MTTPFLMICLLALIPCGENGEFHTLVIDGPMFSSELNVEIGEKVLRGDFAFADVLPVGV